MKIRDTEQGNHWADIASFWMRQAQYIHEAYSSKYPACIIFEEEDSPKWKLKLGFLYLLSGIY